MAEYQELRDLERTERAKSAKLRATYTERLDAIDNDEMRSELWKQEERQKLRDELAPKISAGREVEEKAIGAAVTKIEKELSSTFGTGSSDIIAFRDAQDRAGRIDNESDAMRIIKQAALSGDNTLALAAFQRSLSQLWMEAVDEFTDLFPKHGGRVKEMQRVLELRDDMQERFSRSNAYRSLAN